MGAPSRLCLVLLLTAAALDWLRWIDSTLSPRRTLKLRLMSWSMPMLLYMGLEAACEALLFRLSPIGTAVTLLAEAYIGLETRGSDCRPAAAFDGASGL